MRILLIMNYIHRGMSQISINTILLDGSLEGPRKVDMGVSRNCIMFVLPRPCIPSVTDEQLLHQHCFYILLGDDELGRPKAYIGQSYDFLARVKDHQARKEFWDTALVFVSKTDEIFASEVAYLEYCGITAARKLENYNLDENKQIPKKPKISSNQESGMELFFKDIRLLTRFYNDCCLFESFEPRQKEAPVEVSHEFNMCLPSKGIKARIRYYETSGRFILLKGSIVTSETGPSLRDSIAKKREAAFKSSSCSRKGTLCEFVKDYDLQVTSPSGAAVFCAGTARNGATDLKDDTGTSFKELYQI